MSNDQFQRFVAFILSARKMISLTVRGNSMRPTLCDGDVVTVVTSEQYSEGDIIVFNYCGEGLLLHRLLAIEGKYVCKGDNAFRFEYIEKKDIIGKVVERNGDVLREWMPWKLSLSLAIGNIYEESKSVAKTKETAEYMLLSAIANTSRGCAFEKVFLEIPAISQIQMIIEKTALSWMDLQNIYNQLSKSFTCEQMISTVAYSLGSNCLDAEEICINILLGFLSGGVVRII